MWRKVSRYFFFIFLLSFYHYLCIQILVKHKYKYIQLEAACRARLWDEMWHCRYREGYSQCKANIYLVMLIGLLVFDNQPLICPNCLLVTLMWVFGPHHTTPTTPPPPLSVIICVSGENPDNNLVSPSHVPGWPWRGSLTVCNCL